MEMLDYDPEQEREEFEALYLTGIKKVMVMMILAFLTVNRSISDSAFVTEGCSAL